MTVAHRETRIVAVPDLPVIRIEREFEAEPHLVFRAWTEPELFGRWIGPRSIETRIEHWDARTGGNWRYVSYRDGVEVARFFGSFHEVRPPDRLVQTFTWEGAPDGVSLEIARFESLPGGRTALAAVSVVESIEIRDAILKSGMEVGVNEGHDKLDELLTTLG